MAFAYGSLRIPTVRNEWVSEKTAQWHACVYMYGDENACLYLRARLCRSLAIAMRHHKRVHTDRKSVSTGHNRRQNRFDAHRDQLAAHTRRSKFVKRSLEIWISSERINEIHNENSTVASHVGNTAKIYGFNWRWKITDVSHFIQFKTCCRFVRCQLQTVHDQSLVFVCGE